MEWQRKRQREMGGVYVVSKDMITGSYSKDSDTAGVELVFQMGNNSSL